MPIDKDTLDLIDKKVLMIDYADQSIINSVRLKEAELKARLLKLLDKMKMVDGKIDKKDPANKKLLMLLNKDLLSIINKSSFKSEVSKYLKNFDDVEKISKTILEKVNGMSLKDYNLNKEKTAAIDEIAQALLNEKELSKNIINPIKKILHRHVTTGISMKDARKEIQTFIDGDHVKHGFMAKYVRSITQEALGRFDGGINQRVATEFGLDAFSIVGSLIKTSSQVCVNMIREVGAFENMAVNGKYAMSDLPNIIAILKLGDGFVKGTTETNYFIMRNHWGCRHQFIPTRFLKRDKEEMQARLTGATNPVSVPVVDTEVSGIKPIRIQFGFEKRFDDYINNDNVPDLIKNVVSNLPKPREIKSEGLIKGSYYSSNSKILISRRIDGQGTFYHEYGHHIDLGINNDPISHSENFGNALKMDVREIYEAFKGRNFLAEMKVVVNGKLHMGGLSDMFDAISAGRFYRDFKEPGHGVSYYKRVWAKEHELFANLFEIHSSQNLETIDSLYKYFPNLYKYFIESLKDLVK